MPEELRLAYRILKNAGYAPEVDDLDGQARTKAVRKLALLRTRVENAYYGKLIDRLGR
ncbi:MAG TPA: hypothetical protein VF936_09360 [Burkholderiales bacterium]